MKKLFSLVMLLSLLGGVACGPQLQMPPVKELLVCVSESEVERKNPGMPRVLRAVGAEAEAFVTALKAGVPRDAYDSVIVLRGVIPRTFVAWLFKDGCNIARMFIADTEYERGVKAQESRSQRR